jgi:hypothetical protein
MADIKKTQHKKINLKDSLPFIIFFFLFFILILSSFFTKRGPEIESLSSSIGQSGEEVHILGKYFGEKNSGVRVEIGGASVSSFIEWTDTRISFIVSDNIKGGLVKVFTEYGESTDIIPFSNKRYLPVQVFELIEPGNPYIFDCSPNKGAVGEIITISGANFGLERSNSKVLFTWISGSSSRSIQSVNDTNMVSALEQNNDYIAWNDREIIVHVPDGASSGNLRIITDKGVSNNVYFEVIDVIGKKLFNNERIYHVQYSINIKDVQAKDDNGIYLWVPRIIEVPEQREVKPIEISPEPMFDNYKGIMLFFLEDLVENENYNVNQSFMVSRYEIETKINTRIRTEYNTQSELYKEYTDADHIIYFDDEIDILAYSIIGRTTHPYLKAELIYEYVIEELDPVNKVDDRDIMSALDQGQGDSFIYSALFCTLARAVRIPARMASGYIIDTDNNTIKHYWNEFYLEKLGWIPVDSILGDKQKFGDFPKDIDVEVYYFGNLDNRHIVLTKGIIELKQMSSDGNLVIRNDVASLQTIHEEYTGSITSYSSQWNPLEVLGVY